MASHAQANRARLEGGSDRRRAWAMLWFLFKHNSGTALWLLGLTAVNVVLRCGSGVGGSWHWLGRWAAAVRKWRAVLGARRSS